MKWLLSFMLPLLGGISSFAQTNSWISPVGGNWHDINAWSAGVLPRTNQTILITNAVSKTVRIGAETAESHSDTLSVAAVAVSGSGDAVNTLLLDAAGTNRPLRCSAIRIERGGILAVVGSAAEPHDLHVQGVAAQGEFSGVTANNLIVSEGGEYRLTNGVLRANEEAIGSASTFDQYGGTNFVARFENWGGYNLVAGRLHARTFGYVGALIVRGGLDQSGGTIDGALVLKGGSANVYNLRGGFRTGGSIVISQQNAYRNSEIVQTGGTNDGYEVRLTPYIDRYGGDVSTCAYTLAGGEMRFTNVIVTAFATFAQYGGKHRNETLQLSGEYVCGKRQPGAYPVCHHGYGRYVLYDGIMESSSIRSGPGGSFAQSGGKLFVETLGPVSFSLSGGELMVNHLVATSFAQHGGRLVADNIALKGGFFHDGGTIEHRGWIQFEYGAWMLGAGEQELGPVHLARLPDGVTSDYSPAVSFPTNAASILRFAPSSSGEWASNNRLIIRNWNGSFRGGGMHQLRFGEDRRGLTREQVAQIYFQDPARVSGLYSARMLPDGEVVPLPRVLAQSRDGQLSLQWPPGFVLQTSTNVSGPFEDIPNALSASPIRFTDPMRFFRIKPQEQ